ncbi:AzlD domain-containing protein [Leeia sp. TBRC 13508]|uniref:AzlD domain-containing protein n=1 Tax=Leeia speluncae TaxID=2884804 RepID=A0ABS8DAQ6_9NEIS|nr:AzlD domain-containing protein [Leeia speluncae]MCB6185006.1 AzlD domain-containing protein [Leeia speluncae]
MIEDKVYLWSCFLVVGIVTFAMRSSFIVGGKRFQLPPTIQQYLRYAPTAALASIVAPEIFMKHGQVTLMSNESIATLVAILSVFLFRQTWIPFMTGMVCLLVLNAR